MERNTNNMIIFVVGILCVTFITSLGIYEGDKTSDTNQVIQQVGPLDNPKLPPDAVPYNWVATSKLVMVRYKGDVYYAFSGPDGLTVMSPVSYTNYPELLPNRPLADPTQRRKTRKPVVQPTK